MGSEWAKKPLGEILKFTNGKSSPDRTDSGSFTVYGSNGPIGRAEFSNALAGTIIVGRVGSYCGSTYLSRKDCWVTDNAIRANSIGKNDISFAFYLLKTLGLNDRRAGSGQPLLNQSILNSIDVAVPPTGTQRAIGVVLSTLDDRIDLIGQTNTTLEAIAQALFKSWFVDFDPVRAKAEGREPEGMDAATAALFPSEFEESELGLIPRGWRAVPFGDLLNQSVGGDWGKEFPDDEHVSRVAIIRGTDLPDLKSSLALRVPIRFTTPRKLASRELEAGDVIIEVSGGSKDQPTGRSIYVSKALLDLFDCPVVAASFCRRFSPITKHIGLLLAQHLSHIYAAGRTWDYQNQSTGISNFQTTYFLKNELVIVPAEEVLSAFIGIAELIVERTQAPQIRRLTELRDTLLPRLISGKLRLPDAERELAEVL